ncbi:MAG: hypothetical protein BV458_08330 [Thermoplasmata archaeon M9B2D]|nr:MAG: hypothetical protein BV458_08330 [Thermoplasmata archaeon M9B2D]
MPEESQVDSKTIVKLNQKIDDLRCGIQAIIILIILIFAIQINQMLASPYSILYGWSPYLVSITVVCFIFAILQICRDDGQSSTESPKQT